MKHLLFVAAAIERAVTATGRSAAWLLLPLTIVTVFDVVSRRFLSLGSIVFQELEWHLHTGLFALTLGWALLRNQHVRIEVVSEQLSPKAQRLIDLVGFLALMSPWLLVLIYFAADHAWLSFLQNEASSSGMGLQHRWIIKSVLLVGLILLLLAAASLTIRRLAERTASTGLRD